MKFKEKPTNSEGKTDPLKLEVDDKDINTAYERMLGKLESIGRDNEIALRPDQTLEGPQDETTSTVEQAEKDFRSIEKIIEKQGLDIRDLRVLEVGSGMGLLLQEFSRQGVTAIGIDMYPRDYWLRDPVAEIEYQPLGALRPEKAGQFGLIVAKNVFDDDRYRFQDYSEMLTQISSLLKEGGIFIKMGEGSFKDVDIPNNLVRADGGTKSFYGTEVYKKVA